MNGSKNNDNQIELTDLALTDDQQGEVKGGPIVMQDCLVSSYQSGGHEGSKATPKLNLSCATGQH